MNIVHLTTFLQGGAGRAIADLACAQHAAGHRVTVVTSETGNAEFGNYPEYLDRLRQAGITLLPCDSLFARNPALNDRVRQMLERELDRDSVDLLHAHAAVPASIALDYAAGPPRRIPVVQTQHGWGINKTPEQAAFDVDVLRRVDRVITTSSATRDLLVSLGAGSRSMRVIPCGVAAHAPATRPAGAASMIQTMRERGLSVVGCIGSVTANKNQRLIIDALHQHPALNVAAVFVGEGGETLMRAAADYGIADRVVACGYQEQASAWLPLFDLLVVPSRTEGQGLVVLEAFRAGVLVVASNIPALAEMIGDGTTGLLFDADSPAKLAAALQRALALTGTERDDVVERGRRRFAADFTVEKMVERHEALYRQLISSYGLLAGESG
jgi:glycosyltransferase involved in cell wall biosynthesis